MPKHNKKPMLAEPDNNNNKNNNNTQATAAVKTLQGAQCGQPFKLCVPVIVKLPV